jgi:hypothetical protein
MVEFINSDIKSRTILIEPSQVFELWFQSFERLKRYHLGDQSQKILYVLQPFLSKKAHKTDRELRAYNSELAKAHYSVSE